MQGTNGFWGIWLEVRVCLPDTKQSWGMLTIGVEQAMDLGENEIGLGERLFGSLSLRRICNGLKGNESKLRNKNGLPPLVKNQNKT